MSKSSIKLIEKVFSKKKITQGIVILFLSCLAPFLLSGQTMGDVNQSGTVDIIDALMTAQYSVGLNPENFQVSNGDVDNSGNINILDALMIAQFTVGIITEFPASSQPTPTPGQNGETMIILGGASITSSGAGVTVSGTTATITAQGTYRITGELYNGRIIVDTADSGTVTLILDGARITSQENSPLSIMSAKETVINLADNSENFLVDPSTYYFEDPAEDEPNAALFSKDDLIISGNGSLTVEGNWNDGITSKDGLIITGGKISVRAIDDGIRGKDFLNIKNGTFTVTSGGDGFKSDNDSDAGMGYILIEGGGMNISSSGGDAIQGISNVTITNGTLTLSAGGGSGVPVDDTISTKGIKSDIDLNITGGNITINTSDDAIHSNNSIVIGGGTIVASTGDDGIHGELTLAVNGGDITILKCYEGLESQSITINNGSINLVSSDDGINAAGAATNYLYINGGFIAVNAAGDGIDSNGYIDMTGGTVLVHGPTMRMNGPLDYDRGFTISGGFLVAAGSSGMAQAPGSNSAQNSLLIKFTAQQAGSLFHIEDASGSNLLTFAPAKTYESVAFSSPNLKSGSTYKVYFGGSTSGTLNSGLYTNGTYTPGTQYTSFTVNSIVTTIGATTPGW